MAAYRIGGMVLALSLAAVTGANAQRGQGLPPRGDRPQMEQRGRGAMGMLFRGIELTSDQQTRVDAIMEKYRPAGRPGFGGRGDQVGQRPGAQGGDTARVGTTRPEQGARPEREVRRERGDTTRVGRGSREDAARGQRPQTGERGEFAEQRQQMIAEIREVLTQTQRTQFDRNIAEMKTRMQERGSARPRIR